MAFAAVVVLVGSARGGFGAWRGELDGVRAGRVGVFGKVNWFGGRRGHLNSCVRVGVIVRERRPLQ